MSYNIVVDPIYYTYESEILLYYISIYYINYIVFYFVIVVEYNIPLFLRTACSIIKNINYCCLIAIW